MYNSTKHAVFSQRMEAWMKSLQNLREEGARLDLIYVSEAASGADAAFADTPIATEQEHVDGINVIRAVKAFCENQAVATSDRQVNIAPFIQ